MNDLALRYLLADPLLSNHEAAQLAREAQLPKPRRKLPRVTQVLPPKPAPTLSALLARKRLTS